MRRIHSQKGQALTEYVLLLFMVTMLGSLVLAPMSRLMGMLEKPLREDLRYSYKYGDAKARGFDEEDGPNRHARIAQPGNFRMFGRGGGR